jgi:hypothetical protein
MNGGEEEQFLVLGRIAGRKEATKKTKADVGG